MRNAFGIQGFILFAGLMLFSTGCHTEKDVQNARLEGRNQAWAEARGQIDRAQDRADRAESEARAAVQAEKMNTEKVRTEGEAKVQALQAEIQAEKMNTEKVRTEGEAKVQALQAEFTQKACVIYGNAYRHGAERTALSPPTSLQDMEMPKLGAIICVWASLVLITASLGTVGWRLTFRRYGKSDQWGWVPQLIKALVVVVSAYLTWRFIDPLFLVNKIFWPNISRLGVLEVGLLFFSFLICLAFHKFYFSGNNRCSPANCLVFDCIGLVITTLLALQLAGCAINGSLLCDLDIDFTWKLAVVVPIGGILYAIFAGIEWYRYRLDMGQADKSSPAASA
jgi:hypothetical protein